MKQRTTATYVGKDTNQMIQETKRIYSYKACVGSYCPEKGLYDFSFKIDEEEN